jgi:tRNA(Ile)-lysidine synthase
MKYVVAVSGGVDSVVLLDMLAKKEDELIVAHFDHGIRPDSANDAEFVRTLAERYGCVFETTREELGADASEELARDRRYAFLNSIAKKHNATIMTAHHADDIIETIAINMIRGTGWRGLAVLGSPSIERPLLDMSKAEIINYAKANGLEWREDSTNQDTTYLRNDVRQKLKNLDEDTKELLRQYRKRQCFLRKEVDNEAGRIVGASPYSRYLLISAPYKPALELLRTVFVRETGYAPTRPQMRRALLAIKTFHSDRQLEVDGNVSLHFTKTHFVVEHRQKVV